MVLIMNVQLSEPDAYCLLYALCACLGFCLPPEATERLRVNPPPDVCGFADAVFRAEGLDPETADRHLYRQVREMVAAAFDRAVGRQL